MNIDKTSQRVINDLVDMAFNDLTMWRGGMGDHKVAHAYSCLGNALKLLKKLHEEGLE